MDAFITGVVAGYGIAIPVGAIAILIMEIGVRRGFRPAFFAGVGTATADFLYAALAVVGGTALASAIESSGAPIQMVSGLVLLVIALIGLTRALKEGAPESDSEDYAKNEDLTRIFGRFLGLTLINPTTVVYFTAVVIGLGVAEGMTTAEDALFVAGAFLASLSWQTVVAAVGTVVGRKLPLGARTAVSVLGNLVILAFALVILAG